MTPGFVSIVGAGPGDPELLTRRAARRLREADLVLHDGLVSEAVLALVPAGARQSVAKRAGAKERSQADINADLIAAARIGGRVVRLKAGDPFVLGRGGEEARALADAGIPFEVVPGVSSAIAAPALAGIPVTHRGVASGFLVVSGHDRAAYHAILAGVPPMSLTLVVLMGLAARADIACHLVSRGWSPTTPTAIVFNASRPDQSVWIGTLARLAGPPPIDAASSPGVIVIGPVVTLRTQEISHGCSRPSSDLRPRAAQLRERG